MPLGICNKENQVVRKPRRVTNQVNSVDKTVFMCDGCTKVYSLKHSLTRHKKRECGVQPAYACIACPKKFKHKYDLDVHMRGRHDPFKRVEQSKQPKQPKKPKQPKPPKEAKQPKHPELLYIGHMML